MFHGGTALQGDGAFSAEKGFPQERPSGGPSQSFAGKPNEIKVLPALSLSKRRPFWGLDGD
ncbi:hypothetical protein AMJ85_06750 [candidate division BRC1 bacterium SM23_51]|nr:MAG: hypothetical protein AMJ85_06750 [candidate division BRC1 bacterium SM23_51]